MLYLFFALFLHRASVCTSFSIAILFARQGVPFLCHGHSAYKESIIKMLGSKRHWTCAKNLWYSMSRMKSCTFHGRLSASNQIMKKSHCSSHNEIHAASMSNKNYILIYRCLHIGIHDVSFSIGLCKARATLFVLAPLNPLYDWPSYFITWDMCNLILPTYLSQRVQSQLQLPLKIHGLEGAT